LVVVISCFIPPGSWGEVGSGTCQHVWASASEQGRGRISVQPKHEARPMRTRVAELSTVGCASRRSLHCALTPPTTIARSDCSHSLRPRRLRPCHCALTQGGRFSFTRESQSLTLRPLVASSPGLDRTHSALISTTQQGQGCNTRLGADILSES